MDWMTPSRVSQPPEGLPVQPRMTGIECWQVSEPRRFGYGGYTGVPPAATSDAFESSVFAAIRDEIRPAGHSEARANTFP